MSKNRIMMLIFVGSEAFFFLGLILAFVYNNYGGDMMASKRPYLDIQRTGFFTFFLFASSPTVWLAERNLRRGNKKAFFRWTITTILLGLVFLAGQGTEYASLLGMDMTISKNVFGSSFFTVTGFHGLHVFIGLVVLSIMVAMVASGKYKSAEKRTFEPASIYWHFVDAVWVAVFSVVYIGAYV
jgi:heme/copper-type cytochrome/quinol oxidase subunit 3